MFEQFLKRRKERKALREWRKSRIGRMLELHTQEYFTKYPFLADQSQDQQVNIVADFYNIIIGLLQSENPFLAMREALAGYVVDHAQFQVLCLTEQEKLDAFYSGCPYISGELHWEISSAAAHIDELGRLVWKNPNICNADLVSYCNQKCLFLAYYINGINIVRSEFNDLDAEKDWLRPFFKSMLIWQEDTLRSKIGLKSLLPDGFDAFKHSIFFNIVINGYPNPYFEWEKACLGDKFLTHNGVS